MKYGYARVRPEHQNTALQIAALNTHRCEDVFNDEALSGATVKRPALARCLKALRRGDTLVMWKLGRLGRSLRDLIAFLDDLKQRRVKFRFLTVSACGRLNLVDCPIVRGQVSVHRQSTRIKLAMLAAVCCSSAVALSFESNVERDDRVAAELRAAGFPAHYEDTCPRGLRGYFSPRLPKTGKPGIVVCVNNHQGAGDVWHTRAHEIAHAAQYCLAPRGLILNDVVDITALVIKQLRAARQEFRDHYAREVQKMKQELAKCAQGLTPNKEYCDYLPSRLKQARPLADYPIVARADAGEKLSLVDLLDVKEIREINELYQPSNKYLELEARAFAFLGEDAALAVLKVACAGAKASDRK